MTRMPTLTDEDRVASRARDREDPGRSAPLAGELDAACRLVAAQKDGPAGRWAYQAFDYINRTYFDGGLPTPLILWTITEYGACLGLTRPSTPAFIRLHPALLGARRTANPWGVPAAHLGVRLAFDVLLHECIHAAIDARWGGWAGRGPTSHNNELWIAEVNRIAPLLGLTLTAARSTTKRVPVEDGATGPRGKPRTKVERTTEGDVPFAAVAKFPYAVRLHRGQGDYYLGTALPFPHALEV
jgi:hypothetical protein